MKIHFYGCGIILILLICANPNAAVSQPVDARAASHAFNNVSNRLVYLEERMAQLEEGWNKLLNVAVIGFRTNQCPSGWMPIANADALLLTGSSGVNPAVRLTEASLKPVTADSMADGISVQKILFCARSSMR